MTRGRPLRLRTDGALLFVSINRPPDNLIDRGLATEFRDLCTRLREEGEFRVLILTADAGAPFCRGTDPTLLTEAATTVRSAAEAEAVVAAFRCAASVASVPFPVVAVIEGDAFDQGLELALAADLRVAGANAQMRMGQLSAGLIPWDGGTQRLPRIVGQAHASDLLLTGRTIDADEAAAMGLITTTAPAGEALAAAERVARTILAGGPIAARYAKEAVLSGMDITLDQGILLETDLTMILQTTADRSEGIRSFLDRRTPEFRGQ
ncbi:MAG: enoyl-CoA hydratase-related protein [Chloroflexi bacterium]|nr:enoyl-CoA hydratase-related protein [Chloroflexota bacterium]